MNKKPMGRPIMMMPPVVAPKLKPLGGVINEDVLVDVWNTNEFNPSLAIKINKLTILGYRMDETFYRLWTIGGFEFYTNNDDFKRLTPKEVDDGAKDKSVEAGKSGTQDIPNEGNVRETNPTSSIIIS